MKAELEMMIEFPERIADRKARLQIPHTPFPERAPEQRIRDFNDIVIGYEAETAMQEASRCLQCPAPRACQEACPLRNDIPGALWLMAQGKFLQAANLYRQTSVFPEICGRVCPQEKLCEGSCTLSKKYGAPSLGKLEMFVADLQRARLGGFPKPAIPPATGKWIAIVGAGPAGLAVAGVLRRRGHRVTVYDAAAYPGGLLMFGIPSFKLPKGLVMHKVGFLRGIGVEFVCNTRVGTDLTIDDLFARGAHAVFVGVGANVDAPLQAPGVDLQGIYQAGEFLLQTNAPKRFLPEKFHAPLIVGERVAVIGGGDTAMDCLRSALRVGAPQVGAG